MMLSDKQKESDKTHPAEVQAAVEYGIDISMLKDNLKLSPAELIRRHQIALNTAEKLRKAKQQ